MSKQAGTLRVGIAGWAVRKEHDELFPSTGTHLQRYSQQFNAVEINSSFYRPHWPATYERWAESVPDDFRFAVKIPRSITHESRLHDTSGLKEFAEQTASLGHKLGPWLVQLPPSLDFEVSIVKRFFDDLRSIFTGAVVCEPRHGTWFENDADGLLRTFDVARVVADPPRHQLGVQPGGWPGLVYYRLHGSPRVYYSAYSESYLQNLAADLARRAKNGLSTWCIFDNTAAGAAVKDARRINDLVRANG